MKVRLVGEGSYLHGVAKGFYGWWEEHGHRATSKEQKMREQMILAFRRLRNIRDQFGQEYIEPNEIEFVQPANIKGEKRLLNVDERAVLTLQNPAISRVGRWFSCITHYYKPDRKRPLILFDFTKERGWGLWELYDVSGQEPKGAQAGLTLSLQEPMRHALLARPHRNPPPEPKFVPLAKQRREEERIFGKM